MWLLHSFAVGQGAGGTQKPAVVFAKSMDCLASTCCGGCLGPGSDEGHSSLVIRSVIRRVLRSVQRNSSERIWPARGPTPSCLCVSVGYREPSVPPTVSVQPRRGPTQDGFPWPAVVTRRVQGPRGKKIRSPPVSPSESGPMGSTVVESGLSRSRPVWGAPWVSIIAGISWREGW